MFNTNITNLNTATKANKFHVAKVDYYDTPYGVETRGFGVKFYNNPNNDLSSGFSNENLVMVGKDNILAYDWGNGVPAGVTTKSFKAKFYGYIYGKYPTSSLTDYKFIINKRPEDSVILYIRTTAASTVKDPSSTVNFNSASLRIGDWIGLNSTVGDYRMEELESPEFAMSQDQWFPFLLMFLSVSDRPYLSLRYQEPDGVIARVADLSYDFPHDISSDYDSQGSHHYVPVFHKKVFSAGFPSAIEDSWEDRDNATLITGTTIRAVTSINFKKALNQSNVLEFEVPLIPSFSTSGQKAFRYDQSTGLYYDDNSQIYLKHGRMIRYSAGYSSNSTSPSSSDFIQRFEGVITDISVNRQVGNSVIKVTCQDILYNAISDIDENYPNELSYSLFGFNTSTGVDQPNGITRPVAYDSWPIKDAVRDLYIKSGIDPVKLYGRKRFLDSNQLISTGDYLIEDRNIILKRRIKYGSPFLTETNTQSDDTYIWGANFGDPIYDKIGRFAETYGYVAEVNEYGEPTFNSVNSPRLVDSTTDWQFTGSWQTVADIAAEGGTYLAALSSGSELLITGEGGLININFIREKKSVIDTFYSWSIPYHEYPSNAPVYSQGKGAERLQRVGSHNFFGHLYGRYQMVSDQVVGFRYITNTLYFRPTKTMKIDRMSYKYRPDGPAVSQATSSIHAKVYFGQVTSPNFTDFLTSTLVISRYKRTRNPNLEHQVQFETKFTLTAGNIYGLRFITEDDSGTPPDYPYQLEDFEDQMYSLANVAIETNPSTITGTKGMSWHRESTIGGPLEPIYESFTDSGLSFAYYPDFTLLGESIAGTPLNSLTKIDVYREQTNGLSSFITGWLFDNFYYSRTLPSGLYRYSSDGIDYTGKNPCQFTIFGSEVGSTTSGNISLPYGKYILNIINLSNMTTGTRITSVEFYDDDFYSPTWQFNTSDNVEQLGFTQSIDDIRNDIIVVADLKGAFRDYTTNEIINVNNPSNQYIFSRAVDVSSIHDPDSIDNVGRKKPFIIFEPSITDQRHADWLAIAVLNRYRRFRKTPNFRTFGIPFLNTNDNIVVADFAGVNAYSDRNFLNSQWVTEIQEKFDLSKYEMQITTTPYEPWASYTPLLNPNIEDFGNNAFINIKMTDSRNALRGYTNIDLPRFDVYEVETSGNRLRIQYDQVIDGDIIAKVMTKSVNGLSRQETVAYLIGRLEDGNEIPEFRQWGKDYELYWDGVDQTGKARRSLGQPVENSGFGSSVVINNVDFIADYSQPGFYAPSGDYFVRFTIFPRSTNLRKQTLDTVNLDSLYNQTIASRLGITSSSYGQTWNLKWGDPMTMNMTVSGQRLSAAVRNIVYHPNNVFYSDENDDLGVKFIFYAEEDGKDNNRLVYYNVSIDHIWPLGYTFLLRNDFFNSAGVGGVLCPDYGGTNTTDWKTAYEKAVIGSELYKKGKGSKVIVPNAPYPYTYLNEDVIAEDWPYAGHISGYILNFLEYGDTAGRFSEEANRPLIMAKNPNITLESGRYRVTNWFNVPYTTYTVDDYIDTKSYHYTLTDTEETPLTFYVNPLSPAAGGWIFNDVPDLTAQDYDNIRRQLALASYYAGPNTGEDTRLTLLISHMFQVKTVMWDGTGRLLKNTKQLIARDPLAHRHSVWNVGFDEFGISGQTAWHTHNLERGESNPPGAPNGNTFYGPKIIKQDPAIFGNDERTELWGSDVLKHPYRTYDMVTSGLSYVADNSYNYGIGFCNITGYPNYGFWTWHGYWLSETSQGDKALNYGIPHNAAKTQDAAHWIKYAHSGDTAALASSTIVYWNLGYAGNRYPDNMILDFSYYGTRSNSNIYQSLLSAMTSGAFQGNHTHLPVHEGINATSDPDAVLQIMINSGFGLLGYEQDSDDISKVHWRIYIEDNPFNYYKADYFRVKSDFPFIWFRSTKQLPWSTVNTSTSQAFVTNFLIESGFRFSYGGWADFGDDQG